ncbi:MAG: riboflavin synthase [Nitrospirota bacterium]
MFTGLITELGKIKSISSRMGGSGLTLWSQEISSASMLGDSISVNGVCLTVVDKKANEISFDLSEETLRSTNLGSLKVGDIVNLESALRPDSRIGGHFVTGHVDTVGRIMLKVQFGDNFKIEIEAPPRVTDFLVEKGSIAVDGISLTVVDILKSGFAVVIIPHTAKMTTLGFKKAGDYVNLEVDILGKYVAKFIRKNENKDLMRTLMDEGYISSK